MLWSIAKMFYTRVYICVNEFATHIRCIAAAKTKLNSSNLLAQFQRIHATNFQSMLHEFLQNNNENRKNIYIYKATARTAKQTTVQNALINTANSSLPLDFYHHHFLRWLFSCQELFAPNFVHFIWGVLLKAKAPLSHEVLTMNAYGISITQYNQRHPHNTHTLFFIFRI